MDMGKPEMTGISRKDDPSTIPGMLKSKGVYFYNLASVVAKMGCETEQEVLDLAKRNKILMVETTDGKLRFPHFQFNDDGIDPAIQDAIEKMFVLCHDSWGVLLCMINDHLFVEGMDLLDVVRSGTPEQRQELERKLNPCYY